jgi:hypothetical protein
LSGGLRANPPPETGVFLRNIAAFCALSMLAGVAEPAAPIATGQQVPDIDSCVSRLDPQLDIGYERISAKCPELAMQLDRGSWAAWLPRGWKEPGNDLSAGGLKELRELVVRESEARQARAAPDVSQLKDVMAGLAARSEEGRWSRFKTWLRSILERREQPSDEDWFGRMASHLGVPQSLRQIVAYCALGAVVLIAAGIILNELRAAGLLSASHPARRRKMRGESLDSAELEWGAIERAPVRDKPRLLLELIVRRLGDRGLLPPAGGLTVRELTAAARLPQPDDRDRLSDLAQTAEQLRYSSREPQSQDLDKSVIRGRELLNRIDGGAQA